MQRIKHKSKFSRLILCTILGTLSGAAQAEDAYQYTVLFNPSDAVRAAEERGRIMIYDGLDDETVERALTEQYGRIENMMFVRTRYTAPDGEIEVEEDGCD